MRTAGLLLVGTGAMGTAYAQVLNGLGQPFEALARSSRTVADFAGKTGTQPMVGDIAGGTFTLPAVPARAIVAVNVATLAPVTKALMAAGVRDILVEKPGAVTAAEVVDLEAAARAHGARVIIAYNRRFLASVEAARRIIAADGGLTSFTFEFTELSDRIAGLDHPAEVKANFFLANSTHVTDLAFFLGGSPRRLDARVSGNLSWHPRAATFVGTGETVDGALFAYHADWQSVGRWGIEATTRAHRLFLKPLEKLSVQKRNTFVQEPVAIDDAIDLTYKPGVYRQVEAWLSGADDERLCTIGEHAARMPLYETFVAGGSWARSEG